MSRRLLAALCSALLSCASRDPVAVKSDTGTPSDTGGEEVADTGKPIPEGAAEALAAYHGVFCRSYRACFSVQFQSAYGDEAGCISRRVKGSLAALFGTGSTLTASDIQNCTKEYVEPLSCERTLEIFGGNPVVPAACKRSGTLLNGAPCAAGDQCKSGFCNFDGTPACGACADKTSLGGVCKDDLDCVESAVCAKGKCVAPSDDKGTCSDTQPCKIAFACKAGTCGARVSSGGACQELEQDCVLGLRCNGTSLVCEPYATAKLGEVCGITATGSLAFCEYGTKCKMTGPSAGTCIVAAKQGEACNKSFTGSTCEVPLQCVSGTCVLISSDACK